MKKFVVCILLIFGLINLLSGCTSTQMRTENIIYKYEDVKDILIRFHVIANSDSKEDQNLKLKVKDNIIEYLYPFLENANSLDEARKIIIQNEDNILMITNETIKENGNNYSARVELAKDNFPDKSYGNITLPHGEYEALRIIIGDGNGKNWWCVMFPPLCFIDVTKGEINEDKSKDELDSEVLKSKKQNEEEKPKIKFKIVEIFNEIFREE